MAFRIIRRIRICYPVGIIFSLQCFTFDAAHGMHAYVSENGILFTFFDLCQISRFYLMKKFERFISWVAEKIFWKNRKNYGHYFAHYRYFHFCASSQNIMLPIWFVFLAAVLQMRTTDPSNIHVVCHDAIETNWTFCLSWKTFIRSLHFFHALFRVPLAFCAFKLTSAWSDQPLMGTKAIKGIC